MDPTRPNTIPPWKWQQGASQQEQQEQRQQQPPQQTRPAPRSSPAPPSNRTWPGQRGYLPPGPLQGTVSEPVKGTPIQRGNETITPYTTRATLTARIYPSLIRNEPEYKPKMATGWLNAFSMATTGETPQNIIAAKKQGLITTGFQGGTLYATPQQTYEFGKELITQQVINIAIPYGLGKVVGYAAPLAARATGAWRTVYTGSKIVMTGATVTGIGADVYFTGRGYQAGEITNEQLIMKGMGYASQFTFFGMGAGMRPTMPRSLRTSKISDMVRGRTYEGFNRNPTIQAAITEPTKLVPRPDTQTGLLYDLSRQEPPTTPASVERILTGRTPAAYQGVKTIARSPYVKQGTESIPLESGYRAGMKTIVTEYQPSSKFTKGFERLEGGQIKEYNTKPSAKNLGKILGVGFDLTYKRPARITLPERYPMSKELYWRSELMGGHKGTYPWVVLPTASQYRIQQVQSVASLKKESFLSFQSEMFTTVNKDINRGSSFTQAKDVNRMLAVGLMNETRMMQRTETISKQSSMSKVTERVMNTSSYHQPLLLAPGKKKWEGGSGDIADLRDFKVRYKFREFKISSLEKILGGAA